jgi:hypothetical protein
VQIQDNTVLEIMIPHINLVLGVELGVSRGSSIISKMKEGDQGSTRGPLKNVRGKTYKLRNVLVGWMIINSESAYFITNS